MVHALDLLYMYVSDVRTLIKKKHINICETFPTKTKYALYFFKVRSGKLCILLCLFFVIVRCSLFFSFFVSMQERESDYKIKAGNERIEFETL